MPGLTRLNFILGVIACAATMAAQPQSSKVTMQNGHVSPLLVKVTYASGTSRNVMVLGIGSIQFPNYSTHSVKLRDEAESEVNVWLDTIAEIRKPNEESAIFVLKTGTERRLWFRIGDCCDNNLAAQRFKVLIVANDDGGQEKIDLARIQKVEFVSAPRQDKAKNAMFDQWIYSPFTGEKLSEK